MLALEVYAIYDIEGGIATYDSPTYNAFQEVALYTGIFGRIIDFILLYTAVYVQRYERGQRYEDKNRRKVLVRTLLPMVMLLAARLVVLRLVPYEAFYFVFYFTIMPFSEMAILAFLYWVLAHVFFETCVKPYFAIRNHFRDPILEKDVETPC